MSYMLYRETMFRKLRKAEKRNEFLEQEQAMYQDRYDDSKQGARVLELEEELLVAKEVSIRLHSELEQSQECRLTVEKLNKELKKHLDDLKDFIDVEVNINILDILAAESRIPFLLFANEDEDRQRVVNLDGLIVRRRVHATSSSQRTLRVHVQGILFARAALVSAHINE